MEGDGQSGGVCRQEGAVSQPAKTTWEPDTETKAQIDAYLRWCDSVDANYAKAREKIEQIVSNQFQNQKSENEKP